MIIELGRDFETDVVDEDKREERVGYKTLGKLRRNERSVSLTN